MTACYFAIFACTNHYHFSSALLLLIVVLLICIWWGGFQMTRTQRQTTTQHPVDLYMSLKENIPAFFVQRRSKHNGNLCRVFRHGQARLHVGRLFAARRRGDVARCCGRRDFQLVQRKLGWTASSWPCRSTACVLDMFSGSQIGLVIKEEMKLPARLGMGCLPGFDDAKQTRVFCVCIAQA